MVMRKAALISILALVAAMALAQDKSSDLKFMVVKAESGKPVRNASVVLHPVDKDGRQSRGGFELKTDADGEAIYNAAPYGKLRVQVLARGFQTYGEDYEIDQPKHEIVVKLKRPQPQYSIYGDTKKKEDEKKPKEQ